MKRSRLALAGAMLAVCGCYQYVPVDTAASAPVGKRIALNITDRGRVALAERFGTGVARIDGMVIRADSNEYVLNVWRVTQIDGKFAAWSGEVVHIDQSIVGGVQERLLSRPRTFVAAGTAAAALGLLGTRTGLFGSGTNQGDLGRPIPPDPSSSRIW